MVWPWGVQVIRINMDVMITHCPNVSHSVICLCLCVFSICETTCPCHYMCVFLPTCPPVSICESTCLSTHVRICVSIQFPACMSVWIYSHVSVFLSSHVPICVFIHLPICLFHYPCIYLPVCLFFRIYLPNCLFMSLTAYIDR